MPFGSGSLVFGHCGQHAVETSTCLTALPQYVQKISLYTLPEQLSLWSAYCPEIFSGQFSCQPTPDWFIPWPLYRLDHRVGRVLSFFSSRRNWDSPNHSAAGDCAPTPLWFWGEGNTRWRERGWESPNCDEGTYTVVLCKYMYFVVWNVTWIYTFLHSLSHGDLI